MRALMGIVTAVGVVIALAVGIAGTGAVGSAPAHVAVAAKGPIVTTALGMMRGLVAGRTDEFLGIPYAAPPVGRLRWRAPQPAKRWRGVRLARTPPECPQNRSPDGPLSTEENCLYLSIYRPRGMKASARLPVLFWIHGGGLTTGSANEYNGSLLADTDRIEVVSINYRLGVFGYVALPSPSAAAPARQSADYGLLDQEAALRWTHDNIARFGGDPRRIAIAGESAGGYSVCSLLTSPAVWGLFSRAIIQSGSCVSTPLAGAERQGAALARSVGCGRAASAARCLRSLSPRRLLRAGGGSGVPIAGTRELPVAPARQVAGGRFADVPILIGTNHDEGQTFAQPYATTSEKGYESSIKASYGGRAAAVLAQYPWKSFPAPYRTAYALGAVWTDSGFVGGIGGCATERLAGELAARTRTFLYQFDDRHAPGLNHDFPGYRWGAGHQMELPFMWPSFNNGFSLYRRLNAGERELSGHMVRWWGAFVRGGAPDVPGQTAWPAHDGDATSGSVMSLRPAGASVVITSAAFGAEHKCSFWDR